MLFHVAKRLVEKAPEAYSFVADSYAKKAVTYILNSKYRKAVNLSSWIKDQYANVPVLKGSSHDETVINVLRYVANNTRYKPDADEWEMPEYWQVSQETISLGTGDCEDGAVLAYCLCRNLGVPANRLMIMCGWVDDPDSSIDKVGHCWLAYRPTEYPLNWVFLDWCYWYSGKAIGTRPFYFIHDQKIVEYDPKGNTIPQSRYQSVWFGFNEESSHTSFRWKQ